jgi:hypothetical protein
MTTRFKKRIKELAEQCDTPEKLAILFDGLEIIKPLKTARAAFFYEFSKSYTISKSKYPKLIDLCELAKEIQSEKEKSHAIKPQLYCEPFSPRRERLMVKINSTPYVIHIVLKEHIFADDSYGPNDIQEAWLQVIPQIEWPEE